MPANKSASRLAAVVVYLTAAFFAVVSSQGHFESFSYTVQTYVYRCVPYTYQSCSSSGWWFWRSTSCSVHTAQQCGNVLETQTRTVQRCQAGWQPEGDCTVPICSPACDNNQVCKSPSPRTCQCLGSGGGACSFVGCSDAVDCYPGTCAGGSSCTCLPGFSGQNCQTLQMKPTVTDCMVKVYANVPQETVVAQSSCYAENVDPQTEWMSTPSPTRVQVTWRVEFSSALGLPQVSYVQNSPVPIGVSNAFAGITLSSGSSYMSPAACVSDAWASPVASRPCNVDILWSNVGVGTLRHNASFAVSASSQTGGQKTGKADVPGGNFATKLITGSTTLLQTKFSVDLNPPTHCLLGASIASCTCFPIYLDQDIRTNEVIEPFFCGWTDDLSGIDHYHVEVFYMQTGYDNKLAENGLPVHTEDIRPPYYNFRFTFAKSGVFSIQLTVYDRANNSARARKLVNYDGQSKLTINNIAPYVAEADAATGGQWISNLPDPRAGNNYTLTVIWTGRYQSDSRYQDTWLRPANPWTPGGRPCTATNNCTDDIYPNRFGRRTVDAIKNMTGIVGYGVAFEIDSRGGTGLINPPAYINVPSTQERQQISIPPDALKDGDTIVLWLMVADATGGGEIVRWQVGLDRSSPSISTDEFKTQTADKYTSSFYVTVEDKQSGIKNITYSIYDVTLKATVSTVTVKPRVLNKAAATNRTKRAADHQCPPEGDSTCYCIPSGTCYTRIQPVDINNCDFDRYIKDPLEIRYTVYNLAGLDSSGTIPLGVLTEIYCRDVTGQWSTGAIVGIVIGLCVPTILLLILIGLMIWRWRVHKDPLPPRARTIYNRTFHRLRTENKYADNVAYVPTSEQAQQIPRRNNLPQKKKENVEDDDDVYYAGVRTANQAKMLPRQVQIDRTLAEGRFAVVKRGTVCLGNNSIPVAVKTLKRGYTSEDHKLMAEKEKFLAGLTPHQNIVKFIASYVDPDEGPVILLELCDMTLKDWLANIKSMSADTREDMLIFTANIARGVEYLHSKRTVHRRLGVRNVLLKKQANGYVAKLIGFGPTAEDSIQSADADESSLPLRYLAPETLDSVTSGKVAYTNKTDVWTYGITVWEIYSRGSKPYPEHGGREVQGLLRRGYRMECPEDCSPDLFRTVVLPCWESNASKRPTMSALCSKIDKFRTAAGQGGDYYSVGANGNAGGGVEPELYDDVVG